MLPALGGLDVLVFTAGVGENSPPVRRAVCNALAFLGLRLDAARNDAPAADSEISSPQSAVRVLVVPTNEEWEIARECLHVCCSAP
jgi:acetate kinase